MAQGLTLPALIRWLGIKDDGTMEKEERAARLEGHLATLPKDEAAKLKALWTSKLDDWGNPLRPANLTRGVYKGGRRPLEIRRWSIGCSSGRRRRVASRLFALARSCLPPRVYWTDVAR